MATIIKSGDGVSRYLRLYRVLSQALAEAQFPAREPLPSEPRLMRDYGVSRSTVRRALARLEAEGRIERKRGSGTFARDGEPAGASRDFSRALDGTAASPATVTSRTIAFQHIQTPAFLVGEQPGFGASALLIRRVRCIGREPMALETTFLPEWVHEGLTRPQLSADTGPILMVLASLGCHSAGMEREFVAVEADPLAADSLELAIGAPVFSVRTLAHDPRHRVLAYVDCLYRPDRYEAHAAIEIGDARTRQGMRKRN